MLLRLHRFVYHLKKLALPEEKIAPYLLEIKNKIENWKKLKKHPVPDKEISKIVGISLASFYRYKNPYYFS